MTSKQILKKAIEKAVKNGWKMARKRVDYNTLGWKIDIKDKGYYVIIFSNDFAKAFWGEGELLREVVYPEVKIVTETASATHGWYTLLLPEVAWEYHLQRMILEEKPLKYIEKFL